MIRRLSVALLALLGALVAFLIPFTAGASGIGLGGVSPNAIMGALLVIPGALGAVAYYRLHRWYSRRKAAKS